MKVLPVLLLSLGMTAGCSSLGTNKSDQDFGSKIHASGHTPKVGECSGQIQGPLVKGQPVFTNLDWRYPTPEPGMRSQPAPGYFAEMAVCPFHPPWLPPQDNGVEGRANTAGDCAFHDGIVCHYHVGPEFCPAADLDCNPGLVEVHCIVPGDEQPTVHGFQLACRDEFNPNSVSPENWSEGKSCGRGMLGLFENCTGQRCCRNGTLTSVDAGGAQHYNLRPNFAICEQPLEVSCRDLLGNMKPHTNHTPHLGEVPGGA